LIVALFGTSHHRFDRLMSALNSLADSIDETIFVQGGHTPIPSGRLQGVDFLRPAELDQKIQGASLVVSQGGFGSIADVLRAGIPLIAVPRLAARGEAKGNQDVLVQALEERGVLTAVHDLDLLPDAVKIAMSLPTTKLPPSTIPNEVTRVVEGWLGGTCSG
jgi:UDP-N-acetylglucosamine transferase subunit ALG13